MKTDNIFEIDRIPLIVREPTSAARGLFLHLAAFGQRKEETQPVLGKLAQLGYVAISLDAFQHGSRGNEDREQITRRVFANFRRYMWPILGQTTLDVCRVINWATAHYKQSDVKLSGLSMGGDIAVAAVGLDRRISAVTAVVSTPDWKRPGMREISDPTKLIPQGEPDIYAQFFYENLNPMTHLEAYLHGPRIHFVCGGDDRHVPPDGALRFKDELSTVRPDAGGAVSVTVLPDRSHLDFIDPSVWWPYVEDSLRLNS